jgi:putative ABC transport system substrate-binding protein
MQSPLTDIHATKVAGLALKNRLPTIAMFPTFPSQGGLMSYGPDLRQLYVHAGSFIDRVLKGARPEHMPIERPTHFYFVVNLKTAKALGLTLPQSVLARADQIIE